MCFCMQGFGPLAAFPSGALADLFGAGAQPSSSDSSAGAHTLAHELLGLPAMSQGFSAKVGPRARLNTPCTHALQPSPVLRLVSLQQPQLVLWRHVMTLHMHASPRHLSIGYWKCYSCYVGRCNIQWQCL